MPADRAMRAMVVHDLAALMRGEVTPSHFMNHTQNRCKQPAPPNDFLVECFWIGRLGPLSFDLPKLKRLEVSQSEYEHLRRWAAILQTDVDWNVEFPPTRLSLSEMLPVPLTIGAMITAGVVLNGVLIIAWALVGLVVGPIAAIVMFRKSSEPSGALGHYPFASIEDRDSAMHLAHSAGVPPFDPKRHGVSCATTLSRWLPHLPMLLVLCALMCAMWPLALWLLWRGDDDEPLLVPLHQQSCEPRALAERT